MQTKMGFFLQKWEKDKIPVDFSRRLKTLRAAKDLNLEILASMIGVGKSTLGRWENGDSMPNYIEIMMLINATKCNGTWLMFGQESMFTEDTISIKNNFSKKTDKLLESQVVKLYAMEAVAGHLPMFQEKAEVLDYLTLPNLPKCDGAFIARGDSMTPVIEKGDILLFSAINHQDELIWGHIHLVAFMRGGTLYKMIKYIDKSDDPNCIRLRSNNTDYHPVDIEWKDILGIAMIRATVRINELH